MAAEELEMTIPIIVRLQGTKETEAKKLIAESGMKVRPPSVHIMNSF